MGLFSKKPSIADVEELRAAMAWLQERVARSEEAAARHEQALADGATVAKALAERLVAAEQRLNCVSTELTNQLNELSSDIDALADERPDAKTADEVVEALRSGQAKLANEQARYEIAFREDLAELAEQVRRLAGR